METFFSYLGLILVLALPVGWIFAIIAGLSGQLRREQDSHRETYYELEELRRKNKQ